MIKSLYDAISQKQYEVQTLMERGINEEYTDQDLLDWYTTIQSSSLVANTAVARRFTDSLLLFNDEENASQITAGEIGALYLRLVEVHPYDIDILESAYHFFDANLDLAVASKALLENGLARIEGKISALRESIEDHQ